MMVQNEQEKNVSEAFSRQSVVFDAIDSENAIHTWIRSRVRNEVLSHIKVGARMLELNCGTGIDSVFFAQRGFSVLATDNADGMLSVLQNKATHLGLDDRLNTRKCSFNKLEELGQQKFDYVFSNFGGLNCTDDLKSVLHKIDGLLEPGGMFTLVIMPKVCPWEMAMALKGYFRTAFRRFKTNGARSHVEGVYFRTHYYPALYVLKIVPQDYRLCSLRGLSIVVPPPFIERFVERYPRLFAVLEKLENRIWDKRPFNRWCDHYMITMQKPLL